MANKINEDLMDELREAQKEPFKYIAFSGGGAKGAIYSGVHETLKDSGVLDGIDEVAGSSAGAITASVIASGITKEDFQYLSQNTNFKDLLGSGTKVPGTGVKVNAGGEPLEEFVRKAISKNVTDYLKSTDVLEVCGTRMQAVDDELVSLEGRDDQESLDRVDALNKQQASLQSIMDDGGARLADINKRVQETDKVTFGDLDLLHNLNPVKFKGLVITATKKSNSELMLFNAENTPDVEIAKAAHASSSIPFVFKPVEIDGVKYVDGGCYDNIPLKYFDGQNNPQNDVEDISGSPDKVKDAKKQGRSLALAFSSSTDMDTNLNSAIYSGKSGITTPNFLVKVVMKIVEKLAPGLKNYMAKEEATYQEVRDNALNVVGLDTKDVGTLSFDGAQENADYLNVKGAMQTARHFENHDIGNNRDPNLATKEFMLQVYEDSHVKRGTLQKIKDKIFSPPKTQDLDPLLDSCKSSAWKGGSSQEVLADFVKKASIGPDGQVSNDTVAMNKIVEIANDPKTPDAVKMQFAQLAGVAIPERVMDIKFKTKDFDAVIASKSVKKPVRVNVIKEIIKAGKAPSAQEKIKKQIAENKGPKEAGS